MQISLQGDYVVDSDIDISINIAATSNPVTIEFAEQVGRVREVMKDIKTVSNFAYLRLQRVNLPIGRVRGRIGIVFRRSYLISVQRARISTKIFIQPIYFGFTQTYPFR